MVSMAKSRESLMTEQVQNGQEAHLSPMTDSNNSPNGSVNGKNGNGNYDEQNIQILEGLEAVRVRPGMYIGATDQRGLHHLIQEVVDNSIDEVMAGYADTVKIIIHADSSVTIEDN